MSNVKKTKAPSEPKVRKPRTKKQPPSKEEQLKKLNESADEVKQMIQGLRDELAKVNSLGLKEIPELVEDEICNLEEELEDINAHCKELKSSPDCVME